MPCTSVDLGLTRLEVPRGDRGRWAGFGYLHKTESLGPPCLDGPPVFPLVRDSPPRTQLPTILLEPLVSGNLVNRFLFCPAPMPAHHSLFIVQGPPWSNGHREMLRVRTLERELSGVFARITYPYFWVDMGQEAHRALK